MALVCNGRQLSSVNQSASANDASLYLDSERHIEAGAAYFGQAYAEALSQIADIELHNLEGARLRLQSMASLLDHALRQYEAAMEFGTKSGLIEHHQRKLRDGGLDREGIRRVLSEAHSRRFLSLDDDQIEMIVDTFEKSGYTGLMNFYIKMVEDLHSLIVTTSEDGNDENEAVWWQELSWKLSTLFTQALEIGKSIAVLNIFTFRLPSSMFASPAASKDEPLSLNI